MQVNFSAVIITLNEEKNIARCIESLQGIADEILVVDSYSDDRTLEICRDLGVKVIQHRFEGYASQKNIALRAAAFDHILSLDADEALSGELRGSILSVKNHWKADGYYFNRLTNYCGKWIRHGGWYPDRKLRLIDRRKGKWGGGEVHEKIIMDENATTRFLNGDLLHYSYYGVSEHERQQEKFAMLSAKKMFEEGKGAPLALVILNPVYTFIRKFVLQMGFLDGYFGFVIARTSARANYRKYAELRRMNARKRVIGKANP